MKTKIPDITTHYKLWISLNSGDGILGDGKWKLLQVIHEVGSISKAAEKLSISYRKAWGDIRKLENLIGFAIVEKSRGGAIGGSTIITARGLHLLKVYTKFHKEIDVIFHKLSEDFIKEVNFI